MEKNMKQRKRVTHVKSGFGDEIDGECRDCVSSIIKDMESNFKTVQSNKLHKSKHKITSITAQRNVNDTSISSTSKTFPQVINTALRSKKFCLARKFPLMEKSQKILKQLKHNQRTPKQRAHLASFQNSPIKKNISRKNSEITNRARINYKQNIVKMKRNSNFSSNKSYDNINNLSVISTNLKHSNSKKPKVLKEVYGCAVNKNFCFENSLKSAVNDNKSDTSDSEYERFLQNNKKNLKKRKPKSSSNKNKTLSKRSKTAKISSKFDGLSDDTSSFTNECKKRDNLKITFVHKKKKKNNTLLSESENDVGNDDVSSAIKEYKQRGKFKFDHKKKRRNVFPSDSESDVINEEIFSRGTSSDSDTADNEALANNSAGSEFVEPRDTEHCSTSDLYPLSIENCMSDSLRESTTNKCGIPVSTDCFEQNNVLSDTSLASDKAACSNVCEFSMKEGNGAQSSNEESDVEILDIILPKSKNTTIRSGEISKINDFSTNFITDYSNNECCQRLKIEEVTSLCSVNTTQRLKVEEEMQEIKNDCDMDKTNEAVYVTDMCKELNQEVASKVNTLEQSNSNKSLSNMSKAFNYANWYNSTVKKEDSDDEVTVVDCILNTSRIKTEKCFIGSMNMNKKEIRNHAIFSSETVSLEDFKLADTKKIPEEMLNKLQASPENSINTKELLELFKKEFQIYQEIIQTEESVEKSLKSLECYQAQKLKNLRALIQNEVDKQCLSEDVNPKNCEQVLYKSQKMCKLEVPENQIKMSLEDSSKFLVGNIKNCCLQKVSSSTPARDSVLEFSTIDNAPSQSTLLPEEKDVKPDLSVLHSISDPLSVDVSSLTTIVETGSMPNSTTIKLLGEKCNTCGKEAMAACQRCAKVFFCSNECGIKYWVDGHKSECGK